MCFTSVWLEHLLIQLVWVVAIVVILNYIVPWVMSKLSFDTGPLLPVVRVIIGAVLVVFLIIVVFGLLHCFPLG